MTVRVVGVAVATLVATATLTGCSPQAPSKNAAPSARPTLTALPDAQPAGADELRVLGTRPGRPEVTVLGAQASGDLDIATAQGSGTDLGTPRVGTLGDAGDRTLSYDTAPSRATQVTALSHNGRHRVWVETSSTRMDAFDWRVWSSDGSGRTLLGDSRRLTDSVARAVGETRPVIAGSTAYWAATDGRGSDVRQVVLGRDLDGRGEVRRLKDVELPASDGAHLLVLSSPRSQGRADGGPAHVLSVDPETGSSNRVLTIPLDDGEQVNALAATPTHLSWVVAGDDGRSSLVVHDRATGDEQAVELHQPGLPTMSLQLTDTFAVWGNGSAPGDAGQYLLDLDDHDIWRLGDLPGLSVVHASDDTVAWAVEDEHGDVEYRVARWVG